MSCLTSFNRCLKAFMTGLSGAVLLVSCQKDPDPTVDCTGLIPTYSADIKAILDASCALSECHSAGSQQAGINLSTYGGASSISSRDRFLGAVRHKKGFTPMPQNGPQLSAEKINLLACWVENGSPE